MWGLKISVGCFYNGEVLKSVPAGVSVWEKCRKRQPESGEMRAPQATAKFFSIVTTFLCLAPLACYHVDAQDWDADATCGSCDSHQDSGDIVVHYDSDSNVYYDTEPEDSDLLDVADSASDELAKPNYCLALDGDEDFLQVFFSSELLITRNWTLEAWVRYADNDSGVQPVLRLGDGDTSIGSYFLYAKYSAGDPMGGWGYNSFSFHGLSSGSPLQTEEWVHLAVTHSLGIQQFFINGVLHAEESYEDDAYEITDDLLIGGVRHPNLTGYLDGYIDDVRISSTVRYVDAFTPTTDYPIDDHTVAQWTFSSAHGDATHEDLTNTVSSELVGDAHIVER